MEKRQGANATSSPVTGCDWICDDVGIHKNLSPFGLRIFLAQRIMFPELLWTRDLRPQSAYRFGYASVRNSF
ncbi:MAG: hypothetical protein A2X48_14160 [Lentisphaerae bacterium GWF2_49_21]|nr:MAG: hypothetical protein A2X48_14160 [Lentisphaerae bacterium GWF2_49_21]